jgi:hypothetical protein
LSKANIKPSDVVKLQARHDLRDEQDVLEEDEEEEEEEEDEDLSDDEPKRRRARPGLKRKPRKARNPSGRLQHANKKEVRKSNIFKLLQSVVEPLRRLLSAGTTIYFLGTGNTYDPVRFRAHFRHFPRSP